MNRAHNAKEAFDMMYEVKKAFTNFSLDLIYGVPWSSMSTWKKNIALALGFDPPHISSYAFTVEPKLF